MTSVQKIIKYLALAFAIFLTVSIVGGIVAGVTGIVGLSHLFGREDVAGQSSTYTVSADIQSLTLNISAAEVRIVSGSSFAVESNHKYLAVSDEDGTLSVTETKKLYNADFEDVLVTVTIPSGHVFSSAEVVTGAGVLRVDALAAESLTLELGAGEARIGTLTATGQASIRGGAGAVRISGGSLKNLDMKMGVGEVSLKSRLEGTCDLEYGIGKAQLTLVGSLADYTLTFDKGLGQGRLEGELMADDATYGSGDTRIAIEGGIGDLQILFE